MSRSTAKIITLTAALEKGAVDSNSNFFCPGYKIVEDRRIRCSKTTGHGSQSLKEALMNSCNPAFMEIEREQVWMACTSIITSWDCSVRAE